jgi:hypothetical protein
MTDSTNWYADTLLKVHFDMHTPGHIENIGRDFEPGAFAATLKDIGAQAVCFFARCAYGWSYYPTEIGFAHPHLTRDLFGEGVYAMHTAGLRVIAYAAIDGLPLDAGEMHPGWIARQPDGSPRTLDGNRALNVCPTTFLEGQLFPQLEEIVRNYGVDGFFLDGVYQYFALPCYCQFCQRDFQKAAGRAIPVESDDPGWATWQSWQAARLWPLLGQAAAAIRAINPDCLLGVNWLGDVRWSIPAPAEIGYLTGDPQMINCTFETAFHLAAWGWRQQPADLMTQRMLTNWQDFSCRTPESIEADYAAGLAGGGKLFIGDLLRPVDVKPDSEVAALLRETFAFAAAHAVATDARRRSDIAILSSPEAVRGHGRQTEVDESSLRGAYQALAEDGLSADILFDDDLPAHLGRYQTLVVPEQRYVRPGAAAAIEQFVSAGGALVITGVLPKVVAPLAADDTADVAPFARLAGLQDAGQHDFAVGYVALRGTPAEGLWTRSGTRRADGASIPVIAVPGAPAQVRPAGAETLAPITAPGPAYQIGACPPGAAIDAPALTRHTYGRGQVYFCALGLAADYWRRGNPGAKYLLQTLVRRATPGLTFERIGPACVQITRADGEKRTVLHLAAYQPDARWIGPQVVESPAALHGVQVRLREARQPAGVRAEPDGITVEPRREGDWLVVEVPPFTLHTALVFEW